VAAIYFRLYYGPFSFFLFFIENKDARTRCKRQTKHNIVTNPLQGYSELTNWLTDSRFVKVTAHTNLMKKYHLGVMVL